jgi:DNA-directed RNA polymerase delta subunit
MQVRGYVDRKNVSFKLKEIRSLLQIAAENIKAKLVKLYTSCNERRFIL